jgi:hypothetical protein
VLEHLLSIRVDWGSIPTPGREGGRNGGKEGERKEGRKGEKEGRREGLSCFPKANKLARKKGTCLSSSDLRPGMASILIRVKLQNLEKESESHWRCSNSSKTLLNMILCIQSVIANIQRTTPQ